MFGDDLLHPADVQPQVFDRDSHIFDEGDRLRIAGDREQESQAGLPHGPQIGLRFRRLENRPRHRQRARGRFHRRRVIAGVLDDDQRLRISLHEAESPGIAGYLARALDHRPRDQLDCRRIGFQHRWHCVTGLGRLIEGENRQYRVTRFGY